MANIKSAKKRIRVTEVKTLRNTMIKSALKTKIKKFEAAIISKDLEASKVTYTDVIKALDMACSKGVLHKNKAARKKSRFTVKFNALNA